MSLEAIWAKCSPHNSKRDAMMMDISMTKASKPKVELFGKGFGRERVKIFTSDDKDSKSTGY